MISYNNHAQLAAVNRAWTAKASRLFGHSLRTLSHKNVLYFVYHWRGRYGAP